MASWFLEWKPSLDFVIQVQIWNAICKISAILFFRMVNIYQSHLRQHAPVIWDITLHCLQICFLLIFHHSCFCGNLDDVEHIHYPAKPCLFGLFHHDRCLGTRPYVITMMTQVWLYINGIWTILCNLYTILHSLNKHCSREVRRVATLQFLIYWQVPKLACHITSIKQARFKKGQGSLLLTWINFNLNMDK